MLTMTIDEVAEMLLSWHDHALEDINNTTDAKNAIEGYFEHMAAGGFEPAVIQGDRGAFLAGEGTLTLDEVEVWAIELGHPGMRAAPPQHPDRRLAPVMVALVDRSAR